MRSVWLKRLIKSDFTQQAFDIVTDWVQARATVGLEEYLQQAQDASVQ